MSSSDINFNETTDKIQNPVPILQQQKSSITTNKFVNPSFTDINKNISNSFLGFMNDLLNKDKDAPIIDHFFIVIGKEDMYNYLSILIIFIVLLLLLLK